MKNPGAASVADTLRVDHASVAVKGDDGWYVLQVAEASRAALSTQSDETKMQSDVHRALLQQKSDTLSKLYINDLMTKHHPVIVPEAFDLLSSYLAQQFLDEKQVLAWGIGSPADDGKDSTWKAAIDGHGKEPLVSLSHGAKIPLQEFLSWYRNRESLIKINKASKEAYLFSLKQMVWQMVRDHLLVDRAFKRKLQNRESVRTQKKWWEGKLLFETEKRLMTDSISFDDMSLRPFFEDNSRRYKDSHGTQMAFSDARDNVLRDYYEYELTKRLIHRLNALKVKYHVAVDEKVLAQFRVEEDTKTIDIYALKKGGTFPRPAFPTIDPLWETWQ
jgi:hypothetical protein